MELLILEEEFSICNLKDYSKIDISRPFVFTGSTDEEKSLVCPIRLVPVGTLDRSDGYTDYLFTKAEQFEKALRVLELSGCKINAH